MTTIVSSIVNSLSYIKKEIDWKPFSALHTYIELHDAFKDFMAFNSVAQKTQLRKTTIHGGIVVYKLPSYSTLCYYWEYFETAITDVFILTSCNFIYMYILHVTVKLMHQEAFIST